ncbi:GNAT family N-acetyltransferase [Proteiniclasticum sp. C24MP]|uniref:GNAT family N-acetyltransferase n=1 Tax=Proteiniclasticum sp. C24MP TaxID=3374101 RepID=UPI003753FB9B
MSITKTKRLELRTLSLNDLDALMDIWGNEEVMRYCGGAGTREQEHRSLQYYITMQKEKGFSPYLVLRRETQEVLGVCGFNPPQEEYDAELMYHFAKAHWGKGYGLEAADACIRYARESLNMKKIGAVVDPDNIPSQRILERIGFRPIGKKWFKDTQKEEFCYELELHT